jgi:CubicO group peptidase (beta-lactamase class C family)
VNLNNLRLGAFALLPLTIALSSGAQKSTAHDSAPMTVVKPESVGFSSERLENLHALIQGEIDRKELAGAFTILARHGKVVDYRTYGLKDPAAASPMTKDTIFRDYSMTKPVTGVAMMILYEQGKWLPMDPIAKYIPEFEHLKVFNNVDGDGKPILADPVHAPTIRELMTHSAGFLYGFGKSKVDDLYKEAKPLQSASLQEMIDNLAKLPLAYQPGHGMAVLDVDGYRGLHCGEVVGPIPAAVHA